MARWGEIPDNLKGRIVSGKQELQQAFASAEKAGIEDLKTISTPQQRTQALGRMPAGKMNKTEQKYAAVLEARKFAGEILWWDFEPINIRLAVNTYYRVDFMIQLASGEIQCVEVKGHWTDDARVKIKVAASLLPFQFIAAKLVKNEWQFEYI